MEHQDRDALDGDGHRAGERETLIPVSTLESWALSAGEPDIRGWDVRTVNGRPLGTVNDLLVDGHEGEIVILDVGLAGTTRHAYVPIRVVKIDRSRRAVVMDSADLPRIDAEFDERASLGRRAADLRPIRYPRSDREVPLKGSHAVDDGTRDDVSSPPLPEEHELERRRAARRHIDRMSTGF